MLHVKLLLHRNAKRDNEKLLLDLHLVSYDDEWTFLSVLKPFWHFFLTFRQLVSMFEERMAD